MRITNIHDGTITGGRSEGNGYEAGLDAFNEGDYTTALNTFRPLAEQGEAQALFKLRVVWECPAGPFAESQDPGSPNS